MADLNSTQPTGDDSNKASRDKLHGCAPYLDWEQVKAFEDWAQGQAFGINRRMGLTIATKPADFFASLRSADQEGAQALTCGLVSLRQEVENVRNMLKAMEIAETRLTLGLGVRDDFDALVKQAEIEADYE